MNNIDRKPPRKLSPYEQQRAVKIEKNNLKLRTLGLISKEEQQKSNAAAWGLLMLASSHSMTLAKKTLSPRL